MTAINQESLKQAGYKTLYWSGNIKEFSKKLPGKTSRMVRLAVWFKEDSDKVEKIYLHISTCYISISHLRTIEELELLINLLSGQND